jgi:hypothetical protein
MADVAHDAVDYVPPLVVEEDLCRSRFFRRLLFMTM